MMRYAKSWRVVLVALLHSITSAGAGADDQSGPANLILHNAKVWTGDPAKPSAEAIAVQENRIIEVGSNKQILRRRGAATKVIDLRRKRVIPGFIDAHTHFENATDWFFEARLIDVDDEATMLARLREVVDRVPEDIWITGTEWGGLAARKSYSAGNPTLVAFVPALAAVDALTPHHPVLFQRHDGAVFVNSVALKHLRISRNSPNPSGGRIGRDPRGGELSGMLFGTAAANALQSIPPKSRERTRVAAKALMAELNRYGITGIHDIARLEMLSQATRFHMNVERSHSDVGIFEDLRARGDLSVRVYAVLTLRNFDGLAAHGIAPGSGDTLIRYGALKTFIDGNLMFAPWAHHPAYSGDFTMRVIDEQTMQNDIVAADKLGFDIATHAFGDKAHWLMLNWYERAIELNGPRDRRFRLVHALFPAPGEVMRAGRIGAVADITPYVVTADAHHSERLLGPERIRNAYAWRTMLDHGVRLNIVSDWPGSYDKTEVLPLDPLANIYYAVTRRPIGAKPADAWHPEQALTIEEALRAYTVNPAWSSREEAIKGSLTQGKLADIVVLSQDILRSPPEALPSTRVLYTILDGKIIYEAN